LTQPIPEVFVLWHPSCALGETLARRIYAWLRPGNGLGPEVYYRSLAAPEASAGGLPLPLPGEQRIDMPNVAPAAATRYSNLQIVVVLINDQMVADPAWRHWLASLARKQFPPQPNRVCLPVALDSTAFNVPSPLRDLNFLRPSGLPVPPETDPSHASAREVVVRSLLKQLTETVCRLMLTPLDRLAQSGVASTIADAGSSKIAIFLSHAKADGTTPARRIRDYIYSQTQLAAFYDENDIPFGSAFSRALESRIESADTAAMISVHSARYASRPWCRRELSMFRRPHEAKAARADGVQMWRLNPTVIVNALEPGSQSAGIPEMGSATLIRWSEDQPEQEEQIVTTVLRDVMLTSFHSALGASIPAAPNHIIINWLPDPATLLGIPAIRDRDADLHVHYPGRGLSGLELETLDEYFGNVTFKSFDQVAP
jgi:hypothetical protein